MAAPEGGGRERERERKGAGRQRDRDREREGSSTVQSFVPFIVADPLRLLPWGRVGMLRDKVR